LRSFAFASAVATAAVTVSVGTVSVGTAAAADPTVNLAGSNARFSGDCRGEDASLAGSSNTVTIRGACRAFQIAGGDNRVLIDMSPGGTIKIYGSNNQVSWTSTGEVDITTVGQNNVVTRAR
jgi:hypothetical protein